MSLTSEDIQAISELVQDLCGICLDASKAYLIEGRLDDLVRRSGCENYVELARRARNVANEPLQSDIIDAITTNETLFFRDGAPFDAFRHKVLPDVIDRLENSPKPGKIRIWSAACSTGQEPYSIAMTIRELIPDIKDYDIKIIGTDISDAAIQQASRGRYAAYELERGLNPLQLSQHFIALKDGWQVSDEIRSMVTFHRLDLRKSFAHLGKFDIVFCRNVAIYFNREDRVSLFQRINQVMQARAALFIGASELLLDQRDLFEVENHCCSALYRKVDNARLNSV